MTTVEMTLNDINKLSLSERIQLVEQIWDNIFNNNEYPDLTAEQQTELNRRIDSYYENPQQGRTWNEIKQNFWQTN